MLLIPIQMHLAKRSGCDTMSIFNGFEFKVFLLLERLS